MNENLIDSDNAVINAVLDEVTYLVGIAPLGDRVIEGELLALGECSVE